MLFANSHPLCGVAILGLPCFPLHACLRFTTVRCLLFRPMGVLIRALDYRHPFGMNSSFADPSLLTQPMRHISFSSHSTPLLSSPLLSSILSIEVQLP
ncbi:hypothetical protein LOD99_1775 [Oopsacas minuta]|uniref:Secreted protein n=1 Tax=Oopsacas minuta TaxID=111878 RepID=A0AAV7K549_9METZ|nr:hypothetical protein LOD99_1775 [Oopsacas minuta]